MTMRTAAFRVAPLALSLLVGALAGCESYWFLPDGGGSSTGAGTAVGGIVSTTGTFSEVLIQGRTFVNGNSATTVQYAATDKARIPLGIDFNLDGKIDPVLGYAVGQTGGVVQILLSQGPRGTVDFVSLTLDGNDRWSKLDDVAVADIDGDGASDILAAASDGVVYLRNPGTANVTTLRDWGSELPDSEFLAGSTAVLTNDEVEAILADVLPAGTNLDDYEVAVEQGYTRVVAGDVDGDGSNDVVASRRLKITLTPKQGTSVPPLDVISGEVQIFQNPGFARDGLNWTLFTVGRHERFAELDRQGASGLMLYDMDGDGDLDIVSGARDDVNAQVAWFENPGRAQIQDTTRWTQWRIGSVRDIISFDIGDVTGDGRPDVIATGAKQQQLLLFEQPSEGPKRDYDWDTYPIVTFDTFQPLDVKILDIDNDGQFELVLGGTEGAVRYFERPADPRTTWDAKVVLTFKEPGLVGLIGYGDLDADGDLDLITVLNDLEVENDAADRVTWIRNDLAN